jgi:hypothetical protein
MFAYSPTPDRSGELLAAGQLGAAQANSQMMQGLGENIGQTLQSLGAMYAEEKGLQAEAAGYDKIGEILGGSMFKDNPAVGDFLGNLRKEKNYRMKIAGYNALFNMAGPISNSMMAQQRVGVQQSVPYARQQINNANIQAEEGPAGDYSYIE